MVEHATSDPGRNEAAREAVVRTAMAEVRTALERGLDLRLADDLGYIGNSSGVYQWLPCLMVDLDAFLFSRSLNRTLGEWLLETRDVLSASLKGRGIDFELRIVEGPYKPAILHLSSAVIVAHLGVFTERTYLESPALKRWAWRKYTCLREPMRLARLSPARPDLAELLHGKKGVAERLAAITQGSVEMYELILPTLEERAFSVTMSDVNFLECCFAYAANCARNHSRTLGAEQADRLGNADFFQWYHANVFASEALLELMSIKQECRMTGFGRSTAEARDLALRFIQPLHDRLAAELAKRT